MGTPSASMVSRAFLAALLASAVLGASVGEEIPPTPDAEAGAAEAAMTMPLVFEEDFEAGADRWEPTDPKAWQVIEEDGDYAFALTRPSDHEPTVRSPVNIAWIRDLSVSAFRLELRFKQTGREYGHRDLCLFFGKQDDARFYYVHFAPQADPHANSIFIVNNQPRVSIAQERTDGTRWQDGVYHTARVDRDARTGRIEVYFDDMTQPAMTAEDTTFVSGAIGIGSFDDTGSFDDIRIWGVRTEPGPESAVHEAEGRRP